MYSAVVQEICKRDKSLEDEEHSGWPFEVDSDKLKVIIQADPLITTQVAKEINIHHSAVFQHLKKIEKVEKHDKWVPHELTTNQKKKIFILKCLLLFYTTISQLHCDVQ